MNKVYIQEKMVIDHVKKFCSDYFFHYLMQCCPTFRERLAMFCREYVYDVGKTTLLSSELYFSGGDRKIILDVPFQDEYGHLFNTEMQNGRVDDAEMARFQIYSMKMIENQMVEGRKYGEVEGVDEIIIYTGTPIENFKHFFHSTYFYDEKHQVMMQNGLIRLKFIQTKLLEEMDMDTRLGLEKVGLLETMKLFACEDAYEKETEDELAKEVKEIYKQYIDSGNYMEYAALERDRLVVQSRIHEGEKRGEKRGMEIGRHEKDLEITLEMIEEKYPGYDYSWVNCLDENQFKYARHLLSKQMSYEEFCDMICKTLH